MKSRFFLFPLLALVCAISFFNTATRAIDNPPKPIEYLSMAENDILAEMNLARTQPQQYAAYVEAFKKNYKGKQLLLPGRKPLNTFDGEAAVDEAVAYLRAAQPLTVLDASKPLSLAAKDHGIDAVTNGGMGHTGSDGSKPNDRVERYGEWLGALGEAIIYRTDSARNMVIGLIIDDGTPGRGHRNDLFNPNFHLAGLSVSEKGAYGQICVINYVGDFKEKGGAKAASKATPAKAASTDATAKPPSKDVTAAKSVTKTTNAKSATRTQPRQKK
jgi:uncharacterized protein YkwD